MQAEEKEFEFADALGTAKFFINLGRKDEANTILDMVLPYCSTMEQYDAIGYVYTANRNFKKGLEIALKQLPKAANPQQMWDMRVNVIRSYLNSNMPNEAYRYIKANKVINPTDQTNLMDEAYALFLLNRKDEGEKILREIITNPSTDDIYNRCLFNLGSYDLRNGDFKTGAKNFLLAGRKMSIWESFSLPNKFWDGGVYPGSTILLMAEGGIGDEIINIRFSKHLQDIGMKPVWYTTRKDLAAVFTRNGFDVITDKRLIQYDWMWTYSMLTPVYLELDEPDLWYGPYLKAIKQKPQSDVKKIGIKISGNPHYDQDLNRSIPLDELLAAIPDEYEVYSFHKDEKINHPRVIEWMNANTTWEETLDKIEEMDCIASSCTSLVHASGAMGKDTFVIVPILKYYLWSNDKIKSPWYGDNTKVLHQQVLNDWSEPLGALKEYL
jgi:tetratricopeptide (TPR) repeat protein